jgi:hypothetical protein
MRDRRILYYVYYVMGRSPIPRQLRTMLVAGGAAACC